jgi:hypothetical protein
MTPQAASERTVSIKEDGKPAQQCRIIKTWRMKDGTQAYEVQAIDTGEVMTIVEAGQSATPSAYSPQTRPRSIVTRIFHWGRSNTPPDGSPIPPESVAVQPEAAAKPAVAQVTATTDSKPEPAPKAKASPAQASDWRLSWGKPVDHTSHKPEGADVAHADQKSSDPLSDPRPYSKLPEEYKADSAKASTPAPSVTPTSAEQPAVISETASASAGTEVPAPAGTVVTAPAGRPTVLSKLRSVFNKDAAMAASMPVASAVPAARPTSPMGIQSVLAAGGGFGGVQYVPVPLMTVPDLTRPPTTPPMPPQAPAPVPPTQNPNAFWMSSPSNDNMAPIASRADRNVMVNAFSPPPGSESDGGNPSPGMMGGNAFPPPNSPMMPAYAYVGVPMAPGMYPQPYGPQAMAMAGYYAPAPVQEDTSHMQELVTMLRHSLYPSHREWAAESLVSTDWRRHPEVAEALLISAREDPAPSVRAGCVRCLAEMRVNTVTAAATLQSLKNDADVRVRHEVEQALVSLGLAQSSVVPAGGTGLR